MAAVYTAAFAPILFVPPAPTCFFNNRCILPTGNCSPARDDFVCGGGRTGGVDYSKCKRENVNALAKPLLNAFMYRLLPLQNDLYMRSTPLGGYMVCLLCTRIQF